MATVFRKAEPADAPAMAYLLARAWQKAYRGILSDALLDGIDPDKRSERIRSNMETNPDFHYYVLEADGEVAGVAGLYAAEDDDLPDTGEIRVFYIRPDKQGQGLGRLMMSSALDALRAEGYARASLWTFRDNAAARAFYEKMGFQFDGKEKTTEHLENARSVRYQYKGGLR